MDVFTAGAREEDLLDAYPRLSRKDIQIAIKYAADTLKEFTTHDTSSLYQ